jgi:hypothetical protein
MIVGLCGYAGSGKSTLAGQLEDYDKVSFAAVLKEDVRKMLLTQGVTVDFTDAEDKKEYRDFLVFWGAFKRKQDPDYWIKQLFLKNAELFADSSNRIVIDDVRYANEARWIMSKGGMAIHVGRPCYGPANSEEADSITELRLVDGLQFVLNDGEPRDVEKIIRGMVKSFLTSRGPRR